MNREGKLKALEERIKDFRKCLGLTQSELAHKINKDREVISRLERGASNPTFFNSNFCLRRS